jgi:hypothetical protein
MKTKLMAMLLMAGSTMFAGVRFGVGVRVGVPVATPYAVVAQPPCPGPGYVWTNNAWVLPPYAGAYWVGPRFYGGHYYSGYWGGRHEVHGRGFRR